MTRLARVIAFLLILGGVAWGRDALAMRVGERAKTFRLKHSNGQVYTLRSFAGRKALLIWYEGAKSRHQNRWLKKQLLKLHRSGKIARRLWASVGIANFQETAWPNALIRLVLRREQRRTPAPLLIDPDGRMLKRYGFRNGRSNLYIFDKRRVLRWKASGPLSRKRARQVLRLIRRLTRE